MKQRFITGFVAGTGFLALLFASEMWFSVLIALMAVTGCYEFARLNRVKPLGLPAICAYLGVLYLAFPWNELFPVQLLSTEQVLWGLLFVLLTVTVSSKNSFALDQAALLVLGVLYIGWGCRYMIETRWLEDGLFWSLLVFVSIWAADSGAYFSGKLWGKRPLWPAISPNKTIEGAVGGTLSAVAVALLFILWKPELLAVGQALLIGLTAGVVGLIGDLIQSAYKRLRGIKDTGAIFPGHGGVLDRTDSWLIVFPFLHLLALLPQS